MSTLEVGLDNLSTVDYRNIFEAIAHVLKSNGKLFTIHDTSVTFDVDKLADTVAQQFTSSNRYPFENKDGTSLATIHMATISQKEAFSDQFEHLILQELRVAFEKALLQQKPEYSSIQAFIRRLPKPITAFSTPKLSNETKTGLKYELDKEHPFEKQRLHIQPKHSGNEPRLKGHKLTIQVQDIKNFDQQLIDGICSYLKTQSVNEDDIDEAKDTLQLMAGKEDSHFAMLRTVFIRESLARIQRSARVAYLVYLYNAMKARRITDPQKQTGIRLLGMLIKRLQLVNEYIGREEDGYYAVTYQGTSLNLRDLFSRSDALNILPIITEIEGSLGESTDYVQGSKTFVNGLKLKLNGEVQIHGGNGRPVFDYYATLLEPESKAYQLREAEASSPSHFRERVLKVALLYYFVFVNMNDPNYNPAGDFERDILRIFREGNDNDKYEALRQLHQKIIPTASRNLNLLRDALVEFLELPNDSTRHHPQTLVLSLKKDVMVKDVDSMLTYNNFFQDNVMTNDGKDALKYIAVEGANASQDVLCKLPLHLTFEPIDFYEADDGRERFTMSYETVGVQALPIFLAPFDSDKNLPGRYKALFQENSRIVLCYRHHSNVPPDSERAFVYRFSYQLLAYAFIKLLADNITGIEKRKLFFPIACIHVQQKAADEPYKKYDEEEFIHALSKTLAHLLAEDYTAGSQGFHLDTLLNNDGIFKLGNALYSLYSALPRRFQLSSSALSASSSQPPRRQLDKLAIVVISSRRSDMNRKTPDTYQATVYGEVIGIERQSDRCVHISTLSTFSTNQPSYLMYEQPAALIAQVKACYAQGYRHFLFVAHAPYSRTLHISDKNRTEDLFFMSKTVIQAMRDVGVGIKVYPIFCDRYYVVNPQRRKKKKALAADSLYIDDLGELSSLSLDPGRRALIFLNLFSGINVKQNPVYNGVMSYSTLVNVYEDDPTYDQYIWSDLLSENIPQSIKGDMVDFITLLHFSRYEKSRDLGFKLDPYTRIIGNTSVGKIAVFPHMRAKVRFNMLAFLTLVRAVLNKEPYQ